MSNSLAGWLGVGLAGILVAGASLLLVAGLVVVRAELRSRRPPNVEDWIDGGRPHADRAEEGPRRAADRRAS